MRLKFFSTLGAIAAGVLVFAAPASAHVVVASPGATQGGWGVLTFRAPTESDTASAVEFVISMPSDTPMSVRTQPKPGWKTTVTRKPLPQPIVNSHGEKTTDYVAEVTIKADGPGVPPGEFDTFNLSVGPFPTAPTVAFPVKQIYSDGAVVNWNEQSADGTTEPEHPAPILKLTSPGSDNTSETPAWPGWVGLGAGIAALAVSIAAFARRRR